MTNEQVSVEYIQKYNQYTEELLSVSDSIIVYDLIKKTNETEKLLEQYQQN